MIQNDGAYHAPRIIRALQEIAEADEETAFATRESIDWPGTAELAWERYDPLGKHSDKRVAFLSGFAEGLRRGKEEA